MSRLDRREVRFCCGKFEPPESWRGTLRTTPTRQHWTTKPWRSDDEPLHLDVASVEPVSGGAAPDGTKGPELGVIGSTKNK